MVGLRQVVIQPWQLAFVDEVLRISEQLVACGLLRLFFVSDLRPCGVACVFVRKDVPATSTSFRFLRCRIQDDDVALHSLLCLLLYDVYCCSMSCGIFVTTELASIWD